MRMALCVLIMVISCSVLKGQYPLIRQGHRGCRGLMPENTIAAMKKAMDLGVDVLEMDVMISQDKQVLLSHDAYFSPDISLKPGGDSLRHGEEKRFLLYTMPYAEIRKWDVGSKHNPAFPRQENFPAYKPLLSELIDSVDQYAKEKGIRLPSFNIEIKSQPQTDGMYHPRPEEYVQLVMDVCTSKGILERMDIQSFDVRPLQLLHRLYPAVKLAYLTSNKKTASENMQDLGFIPAWYSPEYKTVDTKTVQFCHEKRIKIVPWTVNTKPEINVLGRMGVDAVITDYPDIF